jgi:hypothetical protein
LLLANVPQKKKKKKTCWGTPLTRSSKRACKAGANAWSAEELAQLKIDYLVYKEAKEAGTRQSNAACAADATMMGERLHQEVSGSHGHGTCGS